MKISLRDIRAAAGQKLHIPFQESFTGEQMVKPVIGDIFLSTGTAYVKLEGQIETIVKLQCHACLNYFFQSLALDINEEFVYEDYLNVKALSARDRELQREDFFETVPYDGELDLSDVVFQAVILAIPPYCSCGAQCLGPPIYNAKSTENIKKIESQTEPASAEHIDPRWHNLKTILPKDTKDKK